MSYTCRSKNNDGTINEIELTPEQALDLGSGKAIAYFPRDERLVVDDSGQVSHRESAIPSDRQPHERSAIRSPPRSSSN